MQPTEHPIVFGAPHSAYYPAMPGQTNIAVSDDCVPIHFDLYEGGAPALIFVHGWCCDRHYWDAQVAAFSPRYTVVCLDLAGHGDSGRGRSRWSAGAFGEDVAAVVRHLGLGQVVLVGHSMGGPVIVEAARRIPDIVIGAIGADTWGLGRSQQAIAQFLAPFRADFPAAMDKFVRASFSDGPDPKLVERVVTGMSAASPEIAISAISEIGGNDRALRQGLCEVAIPKIAINATPRLSAAEALDLGIDLIPMTGVGHFLMMEDAQTFNRLLAQAVERCVQRRDGYP
jgi:pimeloyl-ACP methyl ester carboxylesterase